MVRRRTRKRFSRYRKRPKRRFFRRRFRRFVSKRNRGRRRRRMKKFSRAVKVSVTGLEGLGYWNRMGLGITDADFATFNVYPFPACPFGTNGTNSPVGSFTTGGDVTLLNQSYARPWAPVLPAAINGHQNLLPASSEIARLAEVHEQFRIVSCELTLMQNKRPGSGTSSSGPQQGYGNNLFVLYNYCEQVAPQDPKSFYSMFLSDPNLTPAGYNTSLPFAYYQNWNDIAGISLEDNRNAGRSGWHRKLLTSEKPVKLFWRPKHYPIGGSNALWLQQWRPDGAGEGKPGNVWFSYQNPVQATRMTGSWVSCDFLRKISDRSLDLFWSGPIIFIVDSACASNGSYSSGPMGGQNNIFQHLFGITVKYHFKVQFRGIRTDRYVPNSKTDVLAGGYASDQTQDWELPGYAPVVPDSFYEETS